MADGHQSFIPYLVALQNYQYDTVKVKVNFTLEQAKKGRRGVEVYIYPFFNLSARWR